MDVQPDERNARALALLVAHLQSLDPDAHTALERLEAVLGPELTHMLVFALAPARRAA